MAHVTSQDVPQRGPKKQILQRSSPDRFRMTAAENSGRRGMIELRRGAVGVNAAAQNAVRGDEELRHDYPAGGAQIYLSEERRLRREGIAGAVLPDRKKNIAATNQFP